jgi:putative endonuclease
LLVIAGLVPAIHDHRWSELAGPVVMDARNKCGHDSIGWRSEMSRLQGEERTYYLYILASRKHGTLYIGVTGDLARLLWEHREGVIEGFTTRYGVSGLVYYEAFGDIRAAIQREKTMKKWPRQWKVNVIERDNPHWTDLFPALAGEAKTA